MKDKLLTIVETSAYLAAAKGTINKVSSLRAQRGNPEKPSALKELDCHEGYAFSQ